jgi:hypothetical protein
MVASMLNCVARRPLGVALLLEQSLLRQHCQPPGQDGRRDAETFAELVEAGEAQARVAKDQHAPRVTDAGNAAGNGTGGVGKILFVHIILIVT